MLQKVLILEDDIYILQTKEKMNQFANKVKRKIKKTLKMKG